MFMEVLMEVFMEVFMEVLMEVFMTLVLVQRGRPSPCYLCLTGPSGSPDAEGVVLW